MGTRAEERQARKIAALESELAALLQSKAVQGITFMMSGIMLFPSSWSKVADSIRGIKGEKKVPVVVDPVFLRKQSANGAFLRPQGGNGARMVLKSYNVLNKDKGCGTAIHESLHLLQYLRVSTPTLDEEAAAFLARAWYHINVGTRRMPQGWDEIMDVAEAVRGRKSGDSPVRVSNAEREKLRAVMHGISHYDEQYD